jgi:acyl-CoA synthetase (AMP-forming)/AMP-acid ligase II
MALITAAAATATWMYLDAKYSIRSDISQIRGGRSVQKYVEKLYNIHGEHDWSFYHVLHATYGHNDDTEALVFESRSWTYGQLRGEIGRLAETFRRMGITNRTVVAMFVNNSPEFMFAWWALYKLGAIPAPINTAITGEHIRHCLRISEAEFLVSTYELYGTVAGTLFSDDGGEGARSKSEDSIHPAVPLLKEMVLYDCDTYSATECESLAESVVLIRHNDLPPITPEMGDFPKASRPRVALGDTGQYLFTSGTTGLPKATTWPSGYSIVGTCPGRHPGMNDKYRRFYICLPMFHGTAT